ncbi:hypothetical protein B0T17DRAFT_597559 [Bombardia bombarda]|uniref:Uncharacterized protein n=1 Tax=Bombardia bombarda TaxID=252184 RepID=A0AA39X859_9PEZI|nr:hypothetical protein B0T17DRAFT_597559 [Bombardia bombarda]
MVVMVVVVVVVVLAEGRWVWLKGGGISLGQVGRLAGWFHAHRSHLRGAVMEPRQKTEPSLRNRRTRIWDNGQALYVYGVRHGIRTRNVSRYSRMPPQLKGLAAQEPRSPGAQDRDGAFPWERGIAGLLASLADFCLANRSGPKKQEDLPEETKEEGMLQPNPDISHTSSNLAAFPCSGWA